MADLLFGIETEYAISGTAADGTAVHGNFVEELLHLAARWLVHMPDLSGPHGIFIENGSRFYVDCGARRTEENHLVRDRKVAKNLLNSPFGLETQLKLANPLRNSPFCPA